MRVKLSTHAMPRARRGRAFAGARSVVEWLTRDCGLDAASPGEFPGLEAFLAEHRAPLRWPEGHRGFLAAIGARRHGLDALSSGAGSAARRPGGTLGFTSLAAFGFVLEVLVGEELLFTRRPHELRATVHAPEDPVLELHRSLPRRVGLAVRRATPAPAGASCDSACARGLASRAVYHQASDRTSAS